MEASFGIIVLRHVNIGIARGYHHELMGKSRQGQETSTRQGWHTGGVALYGYRFVTHDHPNPHKASRGNNKRTLELDPVRAPVVRTIYDWYLGGGLGLLQVRDRLNADPDHYPPPVPVDQTTARGAWSRSSVWEVLRNPSTPATRFGTAEHESRVTTGPIRLRPGSGPKSPHIPPSSVARSTTRCSSAPRPTSARARACPPPSLVPPPSATTSTEGCFAAGSAGWPCGATAAARPPTTPASQRSKDIPADHPPHVYLNEQRLNDALLPFLATALFGPERTAYRRNALYATAEPERTAPARERASEIEAEIADLERRIGRQLVNLEAEDVTAALRRHVGQRVAELENAIAERRERLVALARASATEAPTLVNVAPLLDTACRSSPTGWLRRPRANYGRCSTLCSSTSCTIRPTAPSMPQSPSTMVATTTALRHTFAWRTGRRPRQDSNLQPAA
jgi:site-specific DNA recombinase